MSPFDDFVHISSGQPPRATSQGWNVEQDFLDNTKGERLFTEGVIADSIRRHYPKHHVSITPSYTCDFIAFGKARDDVKIIPHGNQALTERIFVPPMRRYNDEIGGVFDDKVVCGCFDYVFKGTQFLLYVIEGADGGFGKTKYNYLLIEDLKKDDGEDEKSLQSLSDELIEAATAWNLELHNEVLVFDQGYWQKSPELWQNIQKAEWEDVILDEKRKAAIIDDVIGFFNSEDRYAEFNVPWKRGVIFYGPPGNGKTISTKALMHQVSKCTSPTIETLYVKTFNSYGGPEFGIRQIFLKARQMAPCLLIFEDIDSLVNFSVRSYFLNEVDGLESNHGILMIGSTNHLERLDPGIAKRPSRFDRKYLYDIPTKDERVQYAEYWRNKLKDNKKVDFPKEMSARFADITENFSFAYMKEAFVAALLVIVAGRDKNSLIRTYGDPLSDNVLWNELKKQVENLRKEMEDESQSSSVGEGIARSAFANTPYIRRPHEVMAAGYTSLGSTILGDDRREETEPSSHQSHRVIPRRVRPFDIGKNVVPRYM